MYGLRGSRRWTKKLLLLPLPRLLQVSWEVLPTLNQPTDRPLQQRTRMEGVGLLVAILQLTRLSLHWSSLRLLQLRMVVLGQRQCLHLWRQVCPSAVQPLLQQQQAMKELQSRIVQVLVVSQLLIRV
jgi:hypothetical protein